MKCNPRKLLLLVFVFAFISSNVLVYSYNTCCDWGSCANCFVGPPEPPPPVNPPDDGEDPGGDTEEPSPQEAALADAKGLVGTTAGGVNGVVGQQPNPDSEAIIFAGTQIVVYGNTTDVFYIEGMQIVADYSVQSAQVIQAATNTSNMIGAASVADPVQPSSGTFVHEEADLSIQTGALAFDLKRYYGNSYIHGKAFGAQWRFSADTVVLRGVQINARADARTVGNKRTEVLGLYHQALAAYEAVYGRLS